MADPPPRLRPEALFRVAKAKGPRLSGAVNKLAKILLLTFAGLLFVLVIASVMAWMSVQSYLRSDAFRVFLSQQAGHALGVEGEFQPLTWQGSSIYSEGYSGRGKDSPLESVELQQIRAHLDLHALWERRWEISQIEFYSAHVQLRSRAQTPETSAAPSPVEIAPPPAPTGALQWLAPFLPTEVRVREMLFQRVNATIPMGTALAEITAENVRAVEENQTWALSSRGGKAEIPGLPKLDFISHQGRASRTQFSLSEAEFRVQNQGKIKASGDIPFGGENPAKLRLELDQVPVTPFLPEDWRARLTGDLTGTLNLTQTGTDSSLLGHLRLLNGKLEALPILRKISDFTRMPEFLSLRFKQAEGDVEWKPDSAHVRNLSIEAENLLRVTGDLGRDAEALSGQLRLGVTPTALQYVPGARDKVFVEQTDQYVWTPVVISGTADNPQEDLTGRLAEAALGTVKKTVENAVEELKSKAGDAVNSLYDFLRGPSRQIPTPTPTPSATEKSSAL